MNNIDTTNKIIKIARKLVGYKKTNTAIDIDEVVIIIEPWNTIQASVINVNQGGKPHFSIKEIKNLLNRKKPNIEFRASNQEQQEELEKSIIECFGGKEGLIEQLKNIDTTGTFYAQVDNFKPFCDAYHIKNENGVEIYIKLYVEEKPKDKAKFVIVVRCHKDR